MQNTFPLKTKRRNHVIPKRAPNAVNKSIPLIMTFLVSRNYISHINLPLYISQDEFCTLAPGSVTVSSKNGKSIFNGRSFYLDNRTKNTDTLFTVTVIPVTGIISFGNDQTTWLGVFDLFGITQWGSILTASLTSLSKAFYAAVKLKNIPAVFPLNVTNVSHMFSYATNFNSKNVINWNVSKVTDMSNMFANATSFNQPLNKWIVNNVVNFSSMFFLATSFNQDISNWTFKQSITDISNNLFDNMLGTYSFSNYNNGLIASKWPSKVIKLGDTSENDNRYINLFTGLNFLSERNITLAQYSLLLNKFQVNNSVIGIPTSVYDAQQNLIPDEEYAYSNLIDKNKNGIYSPLTPTTRLFYFTLLATDVPFTILSGNSRLDPSLYVFDQINKSILLLVDPDPVKYSGKSISVQYLTNTYTITL